MTDFGGPPVPDHDLFEGNGAPTGGPGWRKRITSHETFAHDSIDSLGYDWERIADPDIEPVFPFKIYLPASTDEIAAAVTEAKERGETLLVRGKGHSSNDLVLAERASVLLTEKLTRILDIDEEAMTVTVQAGAITADLDEVLGRRGYGLPVIGDHNHITAAGFASVGGVSPTSHRYGMFVDNVERLEYVDWDGKLRTCSRDENAADFYKVLCGLGRHGVIATLTVRFIKIDKYKTVLHNDQSHFRDRHEFIKHSLASMSDPGDAMMLRGIWLDLPLKPEKSFELGQFSRYVHGDPSKMQAVRERVSYGYLHRIGYAAGRLPAKADRALKMLGMLGILFSPKYATIKNIEFFTDKILDSTVADPTRWIVVLSPLDAYEQVFHRVWALMTDFRRRHECFTFLSSYVKGIKSPYLSRGQDDRMFSEMIFLPGINTERMTRGLLDELIETIDDICVEEGAFRYMHTKTTRDPAKIEKLDPNAWWASRASSQAGGRSASG